MKNEIIALLNSPVLDDKVLGLRIMQEQGLLLEIFQKDDHMNLYDLEIKLEKYPNEQGYCIILGSFFFIPSNNNFIGRAFKEKHFYIKTSLLLNNKCFYSDDSIKELL